MISIIYCFYFMYETKSKMTIEEQVEQNKKNVIAFYDRMLNQILLKSLSANFDDKRNKRKAIYFLITSIVPFIV
jgi:hypothetical protein